MTSTEREPGRPVIFGEVLFDRFPDSASVLGGAPFNVAWHLQGFGLAPLFISRVGEDEPGQRVRRAMAQWGMDTGGVQIDARRPTGAVRVSLQEGQPSFDILPERAYDYVDADAAVGAAAKGPVAAVYHGTLIMRNDTSRRALDELCAQRRGTSVFVDVNLRDPWWRESDLPSVLERARWVKVNEDELARIASRLGQPAGTLEDTARRFQALHDIELLVVTRGSLGAAAFQAEGEVETVKPQGEVEVVDTVGAGDAFASVLLLGLLRAWSLPAAMERAQGFASRICRQRGATAANPELYMEVMQRWNET
jgi:fructokinase